MQRLIIKQLSAWKDDPKRKPLILQGIRQCGKTWVLKEFGRTHYRKLVYLSFDQHPEYRDFFAMNKDPLRILDNLAIAFKTDISPGDTLVVFDEIQECPEALASLKYLQEEHPEYHIACAGSLLGIRLQGGGSFPVGKVDFLSMFPMSFSEFLLACGESGLLAYLDKLDTIAPLPQPFFDTLHERLKQYFITGGMPEAVAEWLDRKDVEKLDQVLASILYAYQIDFAKHLSSSMTQKVTAIWQSLPAQLAKENKRFQYNIIKSGANVRDYGEALAWLIDAHMSYRVARIKYPGLPISAHEDAAAFKLFAADIGLLRRLSALDTSVFSLGSSLFTEFKGAFTENFILQSLTATFKSPLRYWSMTNPNYEVDFILQHGMSIIPIEVKSGFDSRGRGLAAYQKRYQARESQDRQHPSLRVRYSLLNLNLTDDLLNIPLFLVDQTPSLLEKCL